MLLRKYFFVLLFLILLLSSPLEVSATTSSKMGLIITYKEEAKEVSSLHSPFDVESSSESDWIDPVTEIRYVKTNKEKQRVMEQLKDNEAIASVEENKQRELTGDLERWSDPLLFRQWWIKESDLKNAWFSHKPNRSVIVAVIDSGVDRQHQDLKNRLTTEGYNFFNNTTDVKDERGHGTAVAGIIAAESDNALGIVGGTGKAPVKVLPIRTTNEEGKTYVSDLIKAIEFAITQKVDVINISMGSPHYSEAEHRSIQKAIHAGIVVVASGGNTALKGNAINYPAAYPEVISVGAMTQERKRASFSTTNSTIDLVAPGHQIVTTSLNDTYVSSSGTSFSAPIVAATAALIKSESPSASVDDISTAIKKTAFDLGQTGKDNEYGHGMLQASQALDYIRKNKDFQFQEMTYHESIRTTDTFQLELEYLLDRGITLTQSHLEQNITRAEFVIAIAELLQFTPQESTPPFTDVDSKSAVAPYLEELLNLGVITGYLDGKFRPNHTLTRGHAAVIIDRAFQLKESQQSVSFIDVNSSHHLHRAIQKLAQHKVTTGFENGTFQPDQNLSHKHALSFLGRAHRVAEKEKNQLFSTTGKLIVGRDIEPGEYVFLRNPSLPLQQQGNIRVEEKGHLIFEKNLQRSLYLQVVDGMEVSLEQGILVPTERIQQLASASGIYPPGMYRILEDLRGGQSVIIGLRDSTANPMRVSSHPYPFFSADSKVLANTSNWKNVEGNQNYLESKTTFRVNE